MQGVPQMEVKVSNITRFATADSIRNIFSPLGEILHIDWYLSPQAKDGTFEADIIYANLSEAKLAVSLNKSELGDKILNVEPIMNRFRFNIAPEAGTCRVGLTSERAQETVKTILIRGLSSDMKRADVEAGLERLLGGEKPLAVALYGKNILMPSIELGLDFDTAMAAVEFSSRSLMLRSMLALRALPEEKLEGFAAPGKHLIVDEAWKTVDPLMKRPEQLAQLAMQQKLSGSSSFKSSTSSIDRHDYSRANDYGRRERSRSPDRSRRHRSRSHERHHRRRSRSRSRRR